MATVGGVATLLTLLRSEAGRDLHRVFVLFLLFWLVDSVHDLKERVVFMERTLIGQAQTEKETRPAKKDGRIEDERHNGDARSDNRRVAGRELASQGDGSNRSAVGGGWPCVLRWRGDRPCAGSDSGSTAGVHWRWGRRGGLRLDLGRENPADVERLGWGLAGVRRASAQQTVERCRSDDLGKSEKGCGLHVLSAHHVLPGRTVGQAVMAEVAKLLGSDCNSRVGTPKSLCRDWAGSVDQGKPFRVAKSFNDADKGFARGTPGDFFRQACMVRGARASAVAGVRMDESLPVPIGEKAEEVQRPAAQNWPEAFASSGRRETSGRAEAKAAHASNRSKDSGNGWRAPSLHSSVA